jgi:hypothetical protein
MTNNNLENMKELLDYMYNEYSSCDYYGIPYFQKFKTNLNKYDFSDILVYQANKFDFNYVIYFILSTPFLWLNTSYLDWIKIMVLLNPRPHPFKRDILDAGYIDIHFLCKYIQVNAIEIFIKQKQIKNEDKIKLLQYFRKIPDFLFIDDLQIEDLDGETFVDIKDIYEMKSKLNSSANVNSFQFNRKYLIEYLEKQITFFSRLKD